MATFKELKQQFVNLDYSELLALAKSSLGKLMPTFDMLSGDGNGIAYMLIFFGACFTADGEFGDKEAQFMADVTGITDRDVLNTIVAASRDNDGDALADAIFDSCPVQLKTELLTLCLCLVSVDETITAEESNFIKRLID